MTAKVTTEDVPLGKPIPNTLIYVLDEHLRPVPQGAAGEIYVSGICVSRGYLNAPEQTAKVFGTDPFDPSRSMYRTGDNGFWDNEGLLHYLGRTDSQVKVRGFRVSLAEIERVVDEAPGVKRAAVVLKQLNDGDKQLFAYLVLHAGGSVEACRQHVQEQLPHHMVPSEFMVLEQLPLTSNGKIDRKSLTSLAAPEQITSVVQPSTETEIALAAIWREVLGRELIGAEDQFFEIGGNSLRAIQVLALIHRRMEVEVRLEQLFSNPTVAELAKMLDNASNSVLETSISSIGGAGSYPVAATQRLLLNIEREYASQQLSAFNRNDLFEITGPFDPTLLQRAFLLATERHEVLRTTFDIRAERQRIHQPGEITPEFVRHDVSGNFSQEALDKLIEARLKVPFEVESQSLVRADLFQTGATQFSLLTSMHQLISDATSAMVLHHDIQEIYGALVEDRPAALSELSFQFKDVSAWGESRRTAEQLSSDQNFWREAIRDASSMVPVATDSTRPMQAALTGRRLELAVPAELTGNFAALAQAHKVTKFVVGQVAIGLLLQEQTSRSEITMGTYSRGRDSVDMDEQIGFYIKTIPLTFRTSPDQSIAEVLQSSQQQLIDALAHQEYPYGEIMKDVGWHRGIDRSPLFDVMVAFDHVDSVELTTQSGGATFTVQNLPRRSKEADLQFVFLKNSEKLDLGLTYNTEIFSQDRAKSFLNRLLEILEAMSQNRPVSELNHLTESTPHV